MTDAAPEHRWADLPLAVPILPLDSECDHGGQARDRYPAASAQPDRFQKQRSRPARRSRGSNPARLRMSGAGRDRQPGRNLALSSGGGYEIRVLKVKKESPAEFPIAEAPDHD